MTPKNLPLLITLSYFISSYASATPPLLEMSVEDLLNIEVVSVSKKAKSLNDSPAAIFVITQDDIKRIGATSIPEALRLAPGVNVARIDSNKWAISTRGFNGRFANKLLVLIDGRNTYTRSFSGVYWENQDVFIEDIERIEVIRGPGATLWGSNAVNGVINIITKHSEDTLGGLLSIGAGSEEQGFGGLRYGGRIGENTTARAYIKGFKKDESTLKSGGEAGDDWDKVQGGFRLDSTVTKKGRLTLQGDAYRSEINQLTTLPLLSSPFSTTFNESIQTFGGNALARYQHDFSATSDYSVQLFYDYYQRSEVFSQESRQVIDIDFHHSFNLLNINDIIWGVGYRHTHDNISISNRIELNKSAPRNRNDQLFSAFIQDEITLLDNTLWLTLGSKFEHNDFSGFEFQPTARLMWAPHHQHRFWGAVSRAVRTPSRLEHDVDLLGSTIPATPALPVNQAIVFQGSKKFKTEETLSYEIGYRTTLINNVSIDLTAFFNDYNNIKSIETGTPFLTSAPGTIAIPTIYNNNINIQTYGFEISTIWQMFDWWRWDAHYNLLKILPANSEADTLKSKSPQQRFSLRSAISPWKNIDLDILFRYTDSNKTVGFAGPSSIKDYTTLDVRIAWRPNDKIELSIVGQNLLAEHHQEYNQEAYTSPTLIDRGMYGKLTWNF